MHEYLTTAEVCDYLRLKERTIYELVARRAIPCSRATGKLLFPRRLIDRWVESHVEMQDARLAAPPPIVAGSSDPLLEWALRESGSGLATLFEGSGAGLKRLAAGEALAAGLHLIGAGRRLQCGGGARPRRRLRPGAAAMGMARPGADRAARQSARPVERPGSRVERRRGWCSARRARAPRPCWRACSKKPASRARRSTCRAAPR